MCYTFYMPKRRKDSESFVTQSQWVEGMEMIKDFFGKIIKRLEISETEVKNVSNQLRDFREEQREINERLEKKIDMNSNSLSLLTKDLREAEKMEFAIYNHEERIKKLEKHVKA